MKNVGNLKGKVIKEKFSKLKEAIEESKLRDEELNQKILDCITYYKGAESNNFVDFICENASIDEILLFVSKNNFEDNNVFTQESWGKVLHTFKEKQANVGQFKQFFDICEKMGFEKTDKFNEQTVLDDMCKIFSAGELERAFFREDTCRQSKVFVTILKKADLPVLTQMLKDVADNDYDNDTRQKYARKISKVGVEKFDTNDNNKVTEFILAMDKCKMSTNEEFLQPVVNVIKKMMHQEDESCVIRLGGVVKKMMQIKKEKTENEQNYNMERTRNKY